MADHVGTPGSRVTLPGAVPLPRPRPVQPQTQAAPEAQAPGLAQDAAAVDPAAASEAQRRQSAMTLADYPAGEGRDVDAALEAALGRPPLEQYTKEREAILRRGSRDGQPALHDGDGNLDVTVLQQTLQQITDPQGRPYLTIPPGVPHGYMGPLTEDAVTRFQADAELKLVDGLVGPETTAALDRVLKEQLEAGRAAALPQTPLAVAEAEVAQAEAVGAAGTAHN